VRPCYARLTTPYHMHSGSVASWRLGAYASRSVPCAAQSERVKKTGGLGLEPQAGQALQVQISATPADEVVLLLPPGAAPFTGTPKWTDVPLICNGQIPVRPCDKPFPIASSDVYNLVIEARAPGVQYTLGVTAQR
jgi:hypothetical protein